MTHRETHDFRTGGAQSPHKAAQNFARDLELIDGELMAGAPYSGAELAEELAIAESIAQLLSPIRFDQSGQGRAADSSGGRANSRAGMAPGLCRYGGGFWPGQPQHQHDGYLPGGGHWPGGVDLLQRRSGHRLLSEEGETVEIPCPSQCRKPIW